jgi:pimeloyl-ACP methyl ester carboxylesterase
MAKTPIAGLLRIGWDTGGRIVQRVVAGHLDDNRLAGLVAIGCDEISYRALSYGHLESIRPTGLPPGTGPLTLARRSRQTGDDLQEILPHPAFVAVMYVQQALNESRPPKIVSIASRMIHADRAPPPRKAPRLDALRAADPAEDGLVLGLRTS